ncbi:hypothetical protein [Adhaeribacter terreus]|uniref:LemA family protein n=1 Tax=Adhaeribacter terreus TaxID=529703 RepID=A0ABW0EC21_9BACT
MKRILFVLFGTFCIAFYSCKTDKTKTTKVKKGHVIAKKTDAEVKSDLDNLQKEMDAAWNEMMASDDQKIENLQTLLARIGRDKSFEKSALTELLTAQNKIKAQRYDRQGVASVAAVDAYDSAQIKLMDATYEIVEDANLSQRDTVAGKLVSQIQEDDSRVPIFRGRYDKAAKAYNQYLKDYQPQIQKLGSPYNEMKSAPLFVEQPLL